MAHPTHRARQQAVALDRLRSSVATVAYRFGVAPPEIPARHRDALYLPTLQMEAISDFLDGLQSAMPVSPPITKAAPKAKAV